MAGFYCGGCGSIEGDSQLQLVGENTVRLEFEELPAWHLRIHPVSSQGGLIPTEVSQCSGVWIQPGAILTAGHCLDDVSGYRAQQISISIPRSGKIPWYQELWEKHAWGQHIFYHLRHTFKRCDIEIHRPDDGADLALMILGHSPLHEFAQPIRLASERMLYQNLRLYGFGETEKAYGEDHQRTFSVPYEAYSWKELHSKDSLKQLVKKVYPGLGDDEENRLLTLPPPQKLFVRGGVCRGDSGGGWFYEESGSDHLVAITSSILGWHWKSGVATSTETGDSCSNIVVSVAVPPYVPWIEAKLPGFSAESSTYSKVEPRSSCRMGFF